MDDHFWYLGGVAYYGLTVILAGYFLGRTRCGLSGMSDRMALIFAPVTIWMIFATFLQEKAARHRELATAEHEHRLRLLHERHAFEMKSLKLAQQSELEANKDNLKGLQEIGSPRED